MFPCLKPPAATLVRILRASPLVGVPFSTATVTVAGLNAFGAARWWVAGGLLVGVELLAAVLLEPPEVTDSSTATIAASASAAISTGRARRKKSAGPRPGAAPRGGAPATRMLASTAPGRICTGGLEAEGRGGGTTACSLVPLLPVTAP